MGSTYSDAGVDIDAGERAVERIKPLVASTEQPGVLGAIGGFGGQFDLAAAGFEDALLVSSTDGVGTKALVASQAERFDTIGIDLVAMCVDDLVCQGATPLFFLDYISVGTLRPEMIEELVTGIADGCKLASTALIGGEMAEHPGVMTTDEFELVGFSVGAVERHKIITGASIAEGDVIVGLASPNLRSNGFSLARNIMFDVAGRSLDDAAWSGADVSVADALLDPSVIYTKTVLAATENFDVKGLAHVTGGGLPGNVNRVLPKTLNARIDTTRWSVPPIFAELQKLGNVASEEMFRVFNMGIGMTIVVPAAQATELIELCEGLGQEAFEIGRVVAGDGSVELSGVS